MKESAKTVGLATLVCCVFLLFSYRHFQTSPPISLGPLAGCYFDGDTVVLRFDGFTAFDSDGNRYVYSHEPVTDIDIGETISIDGIRFEIDNGILRFFPDESRGYNLTVVGEALHFPTNEKNVVLLPKPCPSAIMTR